MKSVAYTGVAMLAASLIASSASAGTITQSTVTLSHPVAGSASDITFEYTTATEIPAGSSTDLLLASGLQTLITVTDHYEACGGVITVFIDGNEQIYEPDECRLWEWTGPTVGIQVMPTLVAPIPAGSVVTIVVSRSNVTVANVGGSIPVNFSTGTDTVDPLPTVVLPPLPTPVPTLGEWAMIILGSTLAGLGALFIARQRSRRFGLA